jgi:HEPN domain-containing protein
MTTEELLLDETHAWMERTRNGLRSAQLLLDGQMYADVLLFCQQAAEKALKGFLAFHQTPFRKTHELSDLFPEILAIDGSLKPALDQAKTLSDYAWRFRYPGAPYEPDEAEALAALQKAETTVREIERRLPAGV